ASPPFDTLNATRLFLFSACPRKCKCINSRQRSAEGEADIDRAALTESGFMSTRPSTTLADLLGPPLVANPFSAMRASLRRRSTDEFANSLAHGGEGWGRRGRAALFFFLP